MNPLVTCRNVRGEIVSPGGVSLESLDRRARRFTSGSKFPYVSQHLGNLVAAVDRLATTRAGHLVVRSCCNPALVSVVYLCLVPRCDTMLNRECDGWCDGWHISVVFL